MIHDGIVESWWRDNRRTAIVDMAGFDRLILQYYDGGGKIKGVSMFPKKRFVDCSELLRRAKWASATMIKDEPT